MLELDQYRTGEQVMLCIDGDWFPAFWTNHADDMSPTGCTAFAQVDGRLAISDDDIDDARWPNESEAEFFMGDDALNDQRAQDEQDRISAAAADARQARRKQRAEAEQARERVSIEYERLFHKPAPSGMRTSTMRKAVAAEQSMIALSKVFSELSKSLR